MTKNGFKSLDELPRPLIPGKEHLVELYYFAWQLAKEHVSHKNGLASEYYMDEAFEDDKIWQWDTCFMALFCRHAHDLFPGIESFDNFYAAQRDDGYISMSHFLETGEDSYPLPCGRINPPLLSWVEWEYYLATGDSKRFQKALRHLLKYDGWIEKNRKREDGSYWFADCGCSGMDNSPRTPRTNHGGAETSFVDLASQQALSALHISKMASTTQQNDIAEKYRLIYLDRAKYVNERLWNERHSIYYDRHTDGNFVNCQTAASFWPMLSEIATESHANALLDHLENPNEFNRPNSVPTLSFDECNYRDDGGYWLGGVWAPTNYMIVRGLMKYKKHRAAKKIAEKYLDTLHRVWKNYEPHTLWECYSPENDRPALNERGELCRKDFVGWTGLGPISMLIETIIGIEVDCPNNRIVWTSDILEEHGIDNLRFGSHKISLRAGKRSAVNEMPKIQIDAPVDIEIEFRTP